MAKTENLLSQFEKAYDEARKKECEELHNALIDVVTGQKASIQNTLFVLELIKFELLQAKYKEIMGVVKLTEKPPVGKIQ